MNSELTEPVKNLFTLMDVVSDKSTVEFFKDKYAQCEIRYGDLKKQLAEDIIQFTSPIRERILDISANDDYLRKVATMGAEKARENASKTVKEVRKIIGFKPF
jgi:tryptophanyl-tRNA synthetase